MGSNSEWAFIYLSEKDNW